VNLRPLVAGDVERAAGLLAAAWRGPAGAGADAASPDRDDRAAAALLERHLAAAPDVAVVADAGGAIAGVGCARVRGEVATLGPIAVAAVGRGTGGALVDALLEHADGAGCHALRAHVDGSDPGAFALLTARGFTAIDVTAAIERPPGRPSAPDGSRGLEVAGPRPGDLDEVLRLDHRLTGHERRPDLEARLRLVARRRGAVVGYLAASGAALGPAVTVDASDLFTLVVRAIAQLGADAAARARLSTAAPTAALAALAVGFRVGGVGVVMSRGAAPPTRPPQLYSLDPEIL
jgi:GNAT superfamily N-acetyltransferase